MHGAEHGVDRLAIRRAFLHGRETELEVSQELFALLEESLAYGVEFVHARS
ncbi:MAG: hypothetical protein WDM79_04070 [Terricaulis sp.]